VEGFGRFLPLSDSWQTFIPEEEPENPLEHRKLAKKISKSIAAPVLWFFIFDEEAIQFEFYLNGKRVATYDQRDSIACKNLYGIPALVGYESGQKRRLSKILSCGDIDFQLEMLEEYFGLCLVPFPELLDEDPGKLQRCRGEEKYLEYMAEEKKLSGRNAPIRAELVWEREGKIFHTRFGEFKHGLIRPHHYYFGFSAPVPETEDYVLHTVRFTGTELEYITQEQFDSVTETYWHDSMSHDSYSIEGFPSYRIHFSDTAPEHLRGKTLIPPRGFQFYRFDEKGRVLLTNTRGSLAVVDKTMKVIAKMQLKGMPVDYLNGHILTAGGGSLWAYFYSSSDKIRIYHIVEK